MVDIAEVDEIERPRRQSLGEVSFHKRDIAAVLTQVFTRERYHRGSVEQGGPYAAAGESPSHVPHCTPDIDHALDGTGVGEAALDDLVDDIGVALSHGRHHGAWDRAWPRREVSACRSG